MIAGNMESGCIIIAGSGLLGRSLAGQLGETDTNIVLIDIKSQPLDLLPAEFKGMTIEGDASDIEILRQAGINHAKAVIAATGDSSINLLIARIARDIYEVSPVIAVVRDAEITKVKDDFGFTVLCPTRVMTQAVMAQLAQEGNCL